MMLCFAPAVYGQGVSLVAQGRTNAVIVANYEGSSELKRAVDELAGYIQQVGGAKIPIENASAGDRLEIHIGQTDYVKSLKLPLNDLDGDGFRICFPAANRIVLVGPTTWGSEFAIYEFIERYLGVRWLFPGDLGTHIPHNPNITIPTAEIVSRPAYMSRTISTAIGNNTGEPVWLFLQRHRRHWTISHHHNLNKLISPDELYDAHPEFFPLIDGKRQKPEPEGYYWQPMLHAKGIVETSVERIDKFFNDHPNETSYSLGINDNNNFQGATSAGMNSVGVEDYSDYYFTYANAVVEGVLKTHPDKWFGCLAYLGVTDPPRSIGVNARIVPHICIDRYGWVSEQAAQRDMQRTRNWHAAAPTLGWYDYIYGDDMYRIPRIYNHLMARYLKFGAENGVRALYAEYYGDPDAWIDGPKLYVFMKLLWDPNADVDALTSEWYRLAVGEQAAVPLARFYAFWEDYWTKRVPKTEWFAQYVDRVYMNFVATGYLDELTSEDLAACKGLMDQVVAKADTPEHKARAAFLAKGYEGVLRNVEYVVRLRNQTRPAGGKVLVKDSFVPSTADADDKVPANWVGWQHEPRTAQFHWDHKNGHTDTHSLAIDVGNPGTSGFFRDVQVKNPAKLYQLTAAVQCAGVNPKAYVGVKISWTRPDGSYLPHKYEGNQFLMANNFKPGAWMPMSVYFRPPPVEGPLTLQIGMVAMYGDAGIVRFDDVRLVVIPNDPIPVRK